jgi:hypothetical protein
MNEDASIPPVVLSAAFRLAWSHYHSWAHLPLSEYEDTPPTYENWRQGVCDLAGLSEYFAINGSAIKTACLQADPEDSGIWSPYVTQGGRMISHTTGTGRLYWEILDTRNNSARARIIISRPAPPSQKEVEARAGLDWEKIQFAEETGIFRRGSEAVLALEAKTTDEGRFWYMTRAMRGTGSLKAEARHLAAAVAAMATILEFDNEGVACLVAGLLGEPNIADWDAICAEAYPKKDQARTEVRGL